MRLGELVFTKYDELTPDLRRVATFFLARPEMARNSSVTLTAKTAGVTVETIDELARRLGLNGYGGLLEALDSDAGSPPDSESKRGEAWYSLRGKAMQDYFSTRDAAQLVSEILTEESSNMTVTLDRYTAEPLERAAELIEAAGGHNVSFLGRRSCFPTAFLLNYVYGMFSDNGFLVPGMGGELSDYLRWVGKGDVLLAISIYPYTIEVVRAVAYAKGKGAKIITISDGKDSPLARLSDVALVVKVESSSFWHSNISMSGIAHALLALLFSRGGEAALDRLRRSEIHLAMYGAYSPDTKPA